MRKTKLIKVLIQEEIAFSVQNLEEITGARFDAHTKAKIIKELFSYSRAIEKALRADEKKQTLKKIKKISDSCPTMTTFKALIK